jgi:hypothetical protein
MRTAKLDRAGLVERCEQSYAAPAKLERARTMCGGCVDVVLDAARR